MAVSNGQLANQTTFNNAFMSRTTDTSTTGVVDLNNAAAASGSRVTNSQREHNSIASFVGKALNLAFDSLPDWLSNQLGSTSDTLQQRIEAIDAEFPIGADELENFNNFWADWAEFTRDAASGTSIDISTEMAGKTVGGSAALGVPTSSPENRVNIFTKANQEEIEDAGGQKVYGRITEAAGVWTLSFYTNEAGTETAHSLSSQDISVIHREVYDAETRPTFGSDMGMMASFDKTADIAAASATQSGKVSTSAQTFAGDKTFNDFLEGLSEWYGDMATDATQGSDQTLATPTKLVLAVTHFDLTSIEGFVAPTKEQFFILTNKTGDVITILENTAATAANGILTGTNDDLIVEDDASIWLYYDMAESRWRIVGGSGGGDDRLPRYVCNAFVEPGDPSPELTFTSGIKLWRFNDGETQRLIGGFQVPGDWVLGTQLFLSFNPVSSSGSGNVVWKADVKLFEAGVSGPGAPIASETFDQTSNQGGAGAGNFGFAFVELTDSSGNINSFPVEGGHFLTFELYRDGANGSDTLAAEVDVAHQSIQIKETLP